MDGGRDNGLQPHRRGGDAHAARAPGEGRRHGRLAVLDLTQDAARMAGDNRPDPGQAHTGGQALEQARPELPL